MDDHGNNEDGALIAYYDRLGERIRAALSAPEEQRDYAKLRLGREFLAAVGTGVPSTIDIFIKEGMPVNYQQPGTLQTALHAAAAAGARQAIRLLMPQPDVNYLARDAEGRLASECAYLFGRDPVLARRLAKKERQQAAAEGVRLARRHTFAIARPVQPA